MLVVIKPNIILKLRIFYFCSVYKNIIRSSYFSVSASLLNILSFCIFMHVFMAPLLQQSQKTEYLFPSKNKSLKSTNLPSLFKSAWGCKSCGPSAFSTMARAQSLKKKEGLEETMYWGSYAKVCAFFYYLMPAVGSAKYDLHYLSIIEWLYDSRTYD